MYEVFVRKISPLFSNDCIFFSTFFSLCFKSTLKNRSVLKHVPILSILFFYVCLDIHSFRKCLWLCSLLCCLLSWSDTTWEELSNMESGYACLIKRKVRIQCNVVTFFSSQMNNNRLFVSNQLFTSGLKPMHQHFIYISGI